MTHFDMKIQAKLDMQNYVDEDHNCGAVTPGKTYVVIGVSDECFRFLNDDGQPYLYPRNLFYVVDASIPRDWVREDFPGGEYYLDPPALAGRGFYEDYFDRKPYAVRRLRRYLEDNNLLKNN